MTSTGLRGLIGQRMAGGRVAGLRFPLQAETAAYIGAIGSPSYEWFDAVNTLIYRLKVQGAWTPLHAGYLLCAETQPGALKEIKQTPGRNATLTGSLTFTPGKGFSGTFNTSNYLDFPVAASATLGGPAVQFAANLSVTNAIAASATSIISASNSPSSQRVVLGFHTDGFELNVGSQKIGGDAPFIGGQLITNIYAGGGQVIPSSSSSFTGWTTGIRTGSNCSNSMTLFSALFVWTSSVTTTQFSAASAIISSFLYEIEAFL